MIHTRQVTVAAGNVIEVFDEVGISPDRYDVTLQVLGGTAVYLVEDDMGANPGPKISWMTAPAEPYRIITNKDPVYVKNFDTNQATICIALTAVP